MDVRDQLRVVVAILSDDVNPAVDDVRGQELVEDAGECFEAGHGLGEVAATGEPDRLDGAGRLAVAVLLGGSGQLLQAGIVETGGIHRIFGIVSGVAAIIDGRPQTVEAGVLGGLEYRGAEGQGHG
ncbi:hypothetical protein [Xanthomonas citri]|uniref:hypothetical protein n=1 Tax=Xanthomonas citri TaxID=346 RepID=UPI00123786D5|nr:hypothetical protein [Xanthomonas citri]